LNRKPRNARSKRALEKREPKAIENPKKALFLRGTSSSEVLNLALTDLHTLKKPFSLKFTKKNPIHPFEDAASLSFFSQKNDASLMVFASHSKKRPHCLTMTRTFGGEILDMVELLIEPSTFRTLAQFKNQKCAIGLKPLLLFAGTIWDDDAGTSGVRNEYTQLKSFFIDFFRGQETSEIDVEGLQYLINISAEEPSGPQGHGAPVDGAPSESKPRVFLRAYLIKTKKSGQKLPRVEVEEMGPRMDFRVGRCKEAEDGMWKDSLKKAKHLEVSLLCCNLLMS
jgi:ribosome production factor 2